MRGGSILCKNLPRVPTTKYLDKSKLKIDILYNGYRPVLYPMKENPLLYRQNGELANEQFTDIQQRDWNFRIKNSKVQLK
ncbi:hypothetical protein KAFR_0G03710 [Kazachstania africana CBS 2517]|uniref:Uncharacterized protein n=1 Tax=Kazachstania africana (strain ATCC 22294 / BCRC 22015 / CBS 2517 / CECT 1963 / NBRC 1671 / NRRL Y-8276) TaxID=1071382 RepID=H2AYF4_KAZAF|nr:hypothetical protein KAFR_0G03710 [Kazachstania africana CBS 2517]CCF59404.1 hypothetical protein KAFR_0G03710 [Kazachstania africana CBS 2517]